MDVEYSNIIPRGQISKYKRFFYKKTLLCEIKLGTLTFNIYSSSDGKKILLTKLRESQISRIFFEGK